MERAFEVVTDAFGNVIRITEIATWETCLANLILMVILIILWAIFSLIYLFIMLIINGFKALFEGKIGLAILHWIIPAVICYFGWTYGGGNLVITAAKTINNNSVNTGKTEGTIKDYFVFPNQHSDVCETHNVSIFGSIDEIYIIPSQFSNKIYQEVWCWRDYIPSVFFLKFKSTGSLQDYIDWIKENGISSSGLKFTKSTEQGSFLGFERTAYFDYGNTKENQSVIVWTVDKHALVGIIDATSLYGPGGMSLDQLELSWFTTVSQTK